MSEFQYYEFRAVDQILDAAAMTELRKLSSRAVVTGTKLSCIYSYSDFRGDPDDLMDEYFDAHLYHANWGTRKLMLRVPIRLLSLTDARTYTFPELITVRRTPNQTHIVIDWNINEEDSFSDYVDEENDNLDRILPVREELLAGDYRCLYLGWLTAADFDSQGYSEDDEPTERTAARLAAYREPPVPPGLKKLSPALKAFAEFIRLDPDLIEAAAQASPDSIAQATSPDDTTEWVAKLPIALKNRILVQLVHGDTVAARAELTQRYREDESKRRPKGSPDRPEESRRTIQQILTICDQIKIDNKRKNAEKADQYQAQVDAERAAAFAVRLDGLTGQEARLWREVEAAIATGMPKKYDRAVELLQDLCGLSKRTNTQSENIAKIQRLREQHRAKKTLISRFNRGKLPM